MGFLKYVKKSLKGKSGRNNNYVYLETENSHPAGKEKINTVKKQQHTVLQDAHDEKRQSQPEKKQNQTADVKERTVQAGDKKDAAIIDEKIFEERQKLKIQQEKYDYLLNSMQAKTLIDEVNRVNAKRAENANAGNDELEIVNTPSYDSEEIKAYIKSQCEVMEKASADIEMIMEEYEIATQHFSDIQLIEDSPVEIHSKIIEYAEKADNITVDRKKFRKGESRLSKNTYSLMQEHESEFPEKLNYIQEQETYYETVKQDMHMIEGERMGLRLDAKELTRRQLKMKNFAMIAAVVLVIFFAVFILALSMSDDRHNVMLFVIVAVLGAILALGLFYLMKRTQRDVVLMQIKLNKATSLLNKTKIKYINAANVLDYEYSRFNVKSSYELSRKYSAYIEMKEEQKKISRLTSMLNDAEISLENELKKLGLFDPHIWLGQVRALFNKNEMVEVRHALLEKRQKLRSQIEREEKRIKDAKQNISRMTCKYPDVLKDALEIIDEFEKKNRK